MCDDKTCICLGLNISEQLSVNFPIYVASDNMTEMLSRGKQKRLELGKLYIHGAEFFSNQICA
jgi:hypothetical protein